MKKWIEKMVDENPTALYYAVGILLLVTPIILQVTYYYIWVKK